MLVTKFSNGKYGDESELFAEPISQDNVKLMGEMIALQTLRTAKRFDFKVADALYVDLIKDLHHMNEIEYMISDAYDLAQTAICFLYEHIGSNVYDVRCKDSKGACISIKLACYREVDAELSKLRKKAQCTEYIDFTDYKALPMDPVDCFEKAEWDYAKADALLNAMHLNTIETALLNCIVNKMLQSEITAKLNIGRGCLNYRKKTIRQKCLKALDF